MRKLTWTQECKTGFTEIDSQHRLLFAIANELLDIENPLKQQDEIKYLLHHLMDYVDTHFKTEERFFQKYGYPGYSEHKLKHEEITVQIKMNMQESKSLTDLLDKLDTMLDNWIRIHILLEDKKFSKWAESKGIITFPNNLM